LKKSNFGLDHNSADRWQPQWKFPYGAYSAAMNAIGVAAERHEVGGRLNNRAENSHQPFRRRERAMQRFRSLKTLQKFSSVHAQVHNQFNQERHLVTRQVYKQRRSCGATTGANPPADLQRVFIRQLEIYGSTGGSVGEFCQLLDVFNRGLVKPCVDSTFRMADIRAAFDCLASGAHFGKLSLVH
jgi:DDE superfamily endonuclease/zinc-binding alcohol dehydrogenase family protein